MREETGAAAASMNFGNLGSEFEKAKVLEKKPI